MMDTACWRPPPPATLAATPLERPMDAALAPPDRRLARRSLRFDGRRVVLVEDGLPALAAGHVRVRSEWTQVSIGTETAWIREYAGSGTATGLGYSHVGTVEE